MVSGSFIKHNFHGDKRGSGALAFYFYNMLNLTSTNITFADNRAEQKMHNSSTVTSFGILVP